MTYIFASDPHGTGLAWINKVQQMQQKYPNAKTVFGGDYIDGRPDSLMTLQFVFDETQKHHAIALLGNHEQMMLSFLLSLNDYDRQFAYRVWAQNGGKTTIASLTGRNWSLRQARYQLFQQRRKLIQWLNTLKPDYTTPNIEFVHAGLNWSYEHPIEQSSLNDKMWIREDYWWEHAAVSESHQIWHHNRLDKAIVSGHTPTCMLSGKYDFDVKNQSVLKSSMSEHVLRCPVITIQYPHEYPRYFTDGGCHSTEPQLTGNVTVFNDDGQLIDQLN